MKIHFVIIFLLVIPVLSVVAKSNDANSDSLKVYHGFSGGMMLHGGWLFSSGNIAGDEFSASGFTKGIGGNVKINLWKHLRLGTEGYVSTLGLEHDGYVRTFWSGLLVEGWSKGKKISPYGGATIGGGLQKSLYLFQGNSLDWEREEDVVYHKSPFFALAPYVGCEVRLAAKFSLSFKLEWLLSVSGKSLQMPTGPRLYIGFLFGH